MSLTLADLNLIARSLPALAVNGRTGDQRVAAYVYRGHAWLETNGGPVGVDDADAGGLAAECHLTLSELESARSDSASNTALTGHEAIAYAARFGLDLTKLADPTEGVRVVTVDEAIEIAKEDPALLSVEAPTWDPDRLEPWLAGGTTPMVATHAAVGNDGRRPCVWGLGTSPEMAFADALRQDGFDAADPTSLRIEPADAEVQERVQSGDVTWPSPRAAAHAAAAAAFAAREAGIAWADREAEALEGPPAGAWYAIAPDARPLVQDLEATEDFDLAEVCNAAAAARWADLVGMAEAEEHFAGGRVCAYGRLHPGGVPCSACTDS